MSMFFISLTCILEFLLNSLIEYKSERSISLKNLSDNNSLFVIFTKYSTYFVFFILEISLYILLYLSILTNLLFMISYMKYSFNIGMSIEKSFLIMKSINLYKKSFIKFSQFTLL